mmetsp:Transcript_628/g.1239  ORF Transcript_628/g.1239 Transcript_628/m.1239 type:complete len:227 (+) Transcript_628:109-789(+)
MPRKRQRSSFKITTEVTGELSEDEPATTMEAMEKSSLVAVETLPSKIVAPSLCQNCPYESFNKSHPKAITESVTVSTEKEDGTVEKIHTSSSADEPSIEYLKTDKLAGESKEGDENKAKTFVEQKGAFRCLECETMKATGAKKVYKWDHIAKHCTRASCWLVAHGIVYDATPFLDRHPAGSESILRRGGKDSTRDFDFHSKKDRRLWGKFAIGRVEGSCTVECVIS